MRYYSDEIKKFFDSEDECKKAEKEAAEAKKRAEEEKEKLQAERKARADEVNEARKEVANAQKKYTKLLSDFLRDYKTYHWSTSNINEIPRFLLNDFEDFFRF